MSRPPRPHFRTSTSGGRTDRGLDYLGYEFNHLVKLQKELAETETGLAGGGEGDFAKTLMELSALLAHVLGVHQEHYATEAYLGTAQSPRSLVRHARRLAYQPDLGQSATGHLVLYCGDGLQGRLEIGFAVASAPRGETPAEDYQTLGDLDVDAAHNEMLPVAAGIPARIEFDEDGKSKSELKLAGTGHGLESEEWLLLVWREEEAAEKARVLQLDTCRENADEDYTELKVSGGPVDTMVPTNSVTGRPPRIMARPASRLHLFGWNADPVQYPPPRIREAGRYEAPGSKICRCDYGFDVGDDYNNGDIYLAEEVREPLTGTWVVSQGDDALNAYHVSNERLLPVALRRCQTVEYKVPEYLDTVSEQPSPTQDWVPEKFRKTFEDLYKQCKEMVQGNYNQEYILARLDRKERELKNLISDVGEEYPKAFEDIYTQCKKLVSENSSQEVILAWLAQKEQELKHSQRELKNFQQERGADIDRTHPYRTTTVRQAVESQLSGTVTTIRLTDSHPANISVNRQELSTQTLLLGHWKVEAPLQDPQPNDQELSSPLELAASMTGLKPGRQLLFSSLDETIYQLVELTKIDPTESGTAKIHWNALTERSQAGSWKLGDLKVFGNVARISHGKAVNEILGDSDGVTPFLRFRLKKSPLTMLPVTGDVVPALEIRVDEVAWSRVADFESSGPNDRHFLVELDQNRMASVVFGDGIKGAIPVAGKRHISAAYRIGVGIQGNAEPFQIKRIKKSHPLIERAVNLTPVQHGADAASPDDMRVQATRYIRTFDRAVSVQDHADLALLYPGVVQATARWINTSGIELVAITAEGQAPPSGELRKFLDRRRDTSVPLCMVEPECLKVALSLDVTFDPHFMEETVRAGVQARLVSQDASAPGLFTLGARKLGQAAHLSEVYASVSAVDGVSSVTITRFRVAGDRDTESPMTAVFDVVDVASRQWLGLDPSNGDHFGIHMKEGDTA